MLNLTVYQSDLPCTAFSSLCAPVGWLRVIRKFPAPLCRSRCDFWGLKGSLGANPERHSAFCLHLRSLMGLPLFYTPWSEWKSWKSSVRFFFPTFWSRSLQLKEQFGEKSTWHDFPLTPNTVSNPNSQDVRFFSLHWSFDIINVYFTPSLICKYLLQTTSSSSVRTYRFVAYRSHTHLRTFCTSDLKT